MDGFMRLLRERVGERAEEASGLRKRRSGGEELGADGAQGLGGGLGFD